MGTRREGEKKNDQQPEERKAQQQQQRKRYFSSPHTHPVEEVVAANVPPFLARSLGGKSTSNFFSGKTNAFKILFFCSLPFNLIESFLDEDGDEIRWGKKKTARKEHDWCSPEREKKRKFFLNDHKWGGEWMLADKFIEHRLRPTSATNEWASLILSLSLSSILLQTRVSRISAVMQPISSFQKNIFFL